MKGTLIFALVFSTQIAFGAQKETWTCTPAAGSIVSSVKVVVDNNTGKASGSLKDGTMSAEAISLKSKEERYKLTGGVNAGHDDRGYSVQLLPSVSDEFELDSGKANGQAVVIYGGFIDCVGDINGAEVLSCEVELSK